MKLFFVTNLKSYVQVELPSPSGQLPKLNDGYAKSVILGWLQLQYACAMWLIAVSIGVVIMSYKTLVESKTITIGAGGVYVAVAVQTSIFIMVLLPLSELLLHIVLSLSFLFSGNNSKGNSPAKKEVQLEQFGVVWRFLLAALSLLVIIRLAIAADESLGHILGYVACLILAHVASICQWINYAKLVKAAFAFKADPILDNSVDTV